jgi:hypothetical protein
VSSNALSTELMEFLSRHIASVEHLEVLLFLHRFSERTWTPADISRKLRSNEVSIALWLKRLASAQLAIASNGAYRFPGELAETRRLTDLLARTYRERPVPVIEYIYARPNLQLLEFSQAFKLRGRP